MAHKQTPPVKGPKHTSHHTLTDTKEHIVTGTEKYSTNKSRDVDNFIAETVFTYFALHKKHKKKKQQMVVQVR